MKKKKSARRRQRRKKKVKKYAHKQLSCRLNQQREARISDSLLYRFLPLRSLPACSHLISAPAPHHGALRFLPRCAFQPQEKLFLNVSFMEMMTQNIKCLKSTPSFVLPLSRVKCHRGRRIVRTVRTHQWVYARDVWPALQLFRPKKFSSLPEEVAFSLSLSRRGS